MCIVFYGWIVIVILILTKRSPLLRYPEGEAWYMPFLCLFRGKFHLCKQKSLHNPKPLLWEGCLGVAETGWGLKISNYTSSPLPSAYG